MSYVKHVWAARVGTGLNRFKDQNDNVLTLTPFPEAVTTPGTPFSAEWMNELEQGVYDAVIGAAGTIAGIVIGNGAGAIRAAVPMVDYATAQQGAAASLYAYKNNGGAL